MTGAGRGVGAAIAHALAEAGAAVVVAARTLAEIEAVAADLHARGARAWAVACDVTDEASVAALGQAAHRHLGDVDLLVNSAGDGASAPLRRISLAEWNRMLAVNATGTFLCTRAFVTGMVERGWGRVVNVASVAGLEGARYIAHYAAAKHAVIGFTRAVAAELAGSGVTINAVCPAYVDTALTERTVANVRAHAGLGHEEALAAVLASAGQERLLGVDEVAAAVLALCRDDAGATNGQSIVLRPGAIAP